MGHVVVVCRDGAESILQSGKHFLDFIDDRLQVGKGGESNNRITLVDIKDDNVSLLSAQPYYANGKQIDLERDKLDTCATVMGALF